MEEMTIKERLAEAKTRLRTVTIDDKIEATFGPNPCQQLHLQTDQGEHLYLACDNKRCVHCGPRKKATIQLQMEASYGHHAYIRTYVSKRDLDRDLERVRKDHQRTSRPFLYQIVGDTTLGYILCSNAPMDPEQRKVTLTDWYRRILDTYHHSVQRLRRSYDLGRVSLVTLRRKGKSGQSPWARVQEYQNKRQMLEQAIIDDRDEATGDIGWHVWEENGKLRSTIDLWRPA